MEIIVLGAGVVGVTTAYALAREGHTVTVIDRQVAAGLETSFANGGQLVARGGSPWSAPGVPSSLIRWIGREDAPLLLRLSAVPGLWRWGPEFLLNCTAERWAHNAVSLHHLAVSSIRELDRIVAKEKLVFDELRKGVLVVHRDGPSFESAARGVERENAAGMRRRAVGIEECITIEPALAGQRSEIAGGVYSEDDRTGDCLKFTQQLAQAASDRFGVRFLYGHTIKSLRSNGSAITGVLTDQGQLAAGAYVTCLGSFSTPLLQRIGIQTQIYPVKGYSATVSTEGWDDAPSVAVIDGRRKMGFTRLGNQLRIAGTAEFDGYSTVLKTQRGEMLLGGLREMFPTFPNMGSARHWTGLRPMTPDGNPVIGATRFSNLFLNSGHGTLGWSLSCGSAKLLCDLLARRAPDVDPARYVPQRYW